MTRRELDSIIASGESEGIEFKRSTGQRSSAAKAVCAMLNGRGGFVLFGVSDQGEIVGQEVSAKTIERVVNELKHIEPFTLLDPSKVVLGDNRSAIVLCVPSGASRPYTYKGRAYVRHGPTTSPMPRLQFERLLEEGMHSTRRWELSPAQHHGLHDLEHAEVTRTVEEAIRRGRLDEPGTRDVENMLMGLGLIRDGRLLNAAVVLFGKADRMLPYYAQCVLRLARFRGTSKDSFEDNRQVYGNAFELMMEAQRFLRQHLPVAGRIVANVFERIDDPLYPPEALREALANAMCHRDYGTAAASVAVAIYDDRLEITSIGHLPFGQTPADLMRPHPSQPWNPLIANVFFRRGLIETWGRGTLKMVELTNAAGLPAPEIVEDIGAVTVRFRPASLAEIGKDQHDVNPFQREILDILALRGALSVSEILNQLRNPQSRSTVARALSLLRQLKLVELIGRGRTAMWKLAGK